MPKLVERTDEEMEKIRMKNLKKRMDKRVSKQKKTWKNKRKVEDTIIEPKKISEIKPVVPQEQKPITEVVPQALQTTQSTVILPSEFDRVNNRCYISRALVSREMVLDRINKVVPKERNLNSLTLVLKELNASITLGTTLEGLDGSERQRSLFQDVTATIIGRLQDPRIKREVEPSTEFEQEDK